MLTLDGLTARVEDFWFRRGPHILLGLVGLVNVVVLLDVVPDWTAPRVTKLVLLTVDVSALLGYAPAVRIVDYLWNPDVRRVLAVESQNNRLEGWEMTPDEFDELTIDDGHLHQWEALHPTYEALAFDSEELTTSATWKGTATDLQLVEFEAKVEDVHGELSMLAEYGTNLRMRFLPFVRAATAGNMEKFVELFEESTLPEGNAIRDAVDDAKPEGLTDERGRSKEVDETKLENPDGEGTPTAKPADRDSEGTPDVTEVPTND